MTQFRMIEIDLDVHRWIEAERRSVSETASEVLRRRLGIGASASRKSRQPKDQSWSGKGVLLPHGTEPRMEYNGAVHSGRIEDGRRVVAGKRFNTPSAAASGVARTRAGKATSLDGRIYWRVRRPGDDRWVSLESLRRGEVAAASLTAEAARLRAETSGRRHTDSVDLPRADRDRA